MERYTVKDQHDEIVGSFTDEGEAFAYASHLANANPDDLYAVYGGPDVVLAARSELLDEHYAGYLDNESRLTEAEKHGLPTLDRVEWEAIYGEDILREELAYREARIETTDEESLRAALADEDN